MIWFLCSSVGVHFHVATCMRSVKSTTAVSISSAVLSLMFRLRFSTVYSLKELQSVCWLYNNMDLSTSIIVELIVSKTGV